MALKVNLAKNAFFSGLAGSSNIALLVLLILAGRYLGVEGFGVLTFALAFVTIFALFADLGVTEILKRAIARSPSETSRLYGNVLIWKVVLSAGTFAAIVVAIQLLRYPLAVRTVVYILGAAALLRSFKLTTLSVFQANERFDLHAVFVILHNILLLAFGATVLVATGDLIAFTCVFLGVRVVDLAAAIFVLHRKIAPVSFQLDRALVHRLQREAISLGLFAVIIEIDWSVDSVMLSLIRSEVDVGLYNAGYRLFDGMMLLPMVLYQAVSPQLHRLYESNQRAHFELAQRAIKYGAVGSALITGCGIVIAPEILHVLFGEEFEGGVGAFRILLVGLAFVTFSFVTQAVLISIDRQRMLTAIGFSALFTNVLVNLALIPTYGPTGAAIATVASAAVATVLSFRAIASEYHSIRVFRLSFLPLAAICIAAGVTYGVGFEGGLGYLTGTTLLYGIGLLVFGVFDREELRSIRRLVAQRGRSSD